MTAAAPISPFMSRGGQKITQIFLARVRATVTLAYASSSQVLRSSSRRDRNFSPRPSVRNPTFVCATNQSSRHRKKSRSFGSSLWLKLPFRFKILHPAHKRVSRVVGLGRSGSFRVALGSYFSCLAFLPLSPRTVDHSGPLFLLLSLFKLPLYFSLCFLL